MKMTFLSHDCKRFLSGILCIVLLSTLFLSCKNTGKVLPSATGARFELLVVMENSAWKSPAGRSVFNLFDQDMSALPQSEPMFKIMQVRPEDFSDLLKPSRNVLYIDISGEKYTQTEIAYAMDYYSYPQCFVRITSPGDSLFMQTIEAYGDEILDYFVVAERKRTMTFHKKDLNKVAVKEVEDMFGIQVDIPVELKKSTKKDNFYWITNNSGYIRQDLIIYTYPYTDPNTFTYEYLTAKRDSVMRQIPGEVEGSYIGTEWKYARPVMKELTVNGEYAAEIKGLWKILGGGSMGGPYYSLTRLDEVNQRVITIEGFVFAPATNKRNAIRTLEAVAHSMKLPQDMNVLGEVNVVAGTSGANE